MQRTNAQNPILRAREAKSLSQVQLSLLTKKSLTTIRNAERGLVSTATLAAIARALGVNVDTLTGRKEPGGRE